MSLVCSGYHGWLVVYHKAGLFVFFKEVMDYLKEQAEYAARRRTLTIHMKKRAKRIKKEMGLPHLKALDMVAREEGYLNWSDYYNRENF